MIDKKFVKKIVSDVFKKNSSLKDHYLMHPEREWFLGFGTALVILLTGVYWSLHIYQIYNSTDVDEKNSPNSNQMVYREKEVAMVLEELAARKEKYRLIKAELSSYSTPSAFVPTNLLTQTDVASSTATSTDLSESIPETETEEPPVETIPPPEDLSELRPSL